MSESDFEHDPETFIRRLSPVEQDTDTDVTKEKKKERVSRLGPENSVIFCEHHGHLFKLPHYFKSHVSSHHPEVLPYLTSGDAIQCQTLAKLPRQVCQDRRKGESALARVFNPNTFLSLVEDIKLPPPPSPLLFAASVETPRLTQQFSSSSTASEGAKKRKRDDADDNSNDAEDDNSNKEAPKTPVGSVKAEKERFDDNNIFLEEFSRLFEKRPRIKKSDKGEVDHASVEEFNVSVECVKSDEQLLEKIKESLDKQIDEYLDKPASDARNQHVVVLQNISGQLTKTLAYLWKFNALQTGEFHGLFHSSV